MILKRLLVLLGFAALLGAGYAMAAGMTVTLTADGPRPAQATVVWGDTVTFTNPDSKAHQITIPRVSFASPTINPGDTFTYVFNGRRGNWGYRQTGGGGNKLGTIVVELDGSVTLKASATVVQWGKSLRLTGKSTFPGTPVNIVDRVPNSGGAWAKIGSVDAGPDGTFSLELKPQRGAQYRAQVAADQVPSVAVRVSMQPTLAIRSSAKSAKVGGLVNFTARVTPAHAATEIHLQRLEPRHGRWLTDQRKRIAKDGRVTFKWKALAGKTRLRLAVRPLVLRPGWVEAVSRSVFVTGVK